MKLFKTFWFVSAFIFSCKFGLAAPCCSRTPSAPNLVLGDDEAQFSLGYSLSKVVAEPAEDGAPIYVAPDSSEILHNYRLDGAILLSDRFQMGGSFSLVNHRVSREDNSDSGFGMGDLRVSLGYEILPSWTYSEWRPQGYLFAVVAFPTGRSIYESQSPTAADVTGNGFYSLSFGSLFLKRWSVWDVFLMPEVHYSLPRTFQNDTETQTIIPGFGGSIGAGLGWTPGSGIFRIGARIHPRIDQGRSIPHSNVSSTALLSLMEVGADASVFITSTDTIMLSYTDQTLLGPAQNSNLNRIFGISFQHRWER